MSDPVARARASVLSAEADDLLDVLTREVDDALLTLARVRMEIERPDTRHLYGRIHEIMAKHAANEDPKPEGFHPGAKRVPGKAPRGFDHPREEPVGGRHQKPPPGTDGFKPGKK